jgi:hypothetical protein
LLCLFLVTDVLQRVIDNNLSEPGFEGTFTFEGSGLLHGFKKSIMGQILGQLPVSGIAIAYPYQVADVSAV